MPVTKRTRYEVLKRDNHTCRYCGATAPDAILTVDHVKPVSLGGIDTPDNLVAACRDCNYGKGSTGPTEERVAEVGEDDIRWAAAIQRAAEAMLAEHDAKRKRHEWFLREWREWDENYSKLPDGWAKSLDYWLGAGLPKKVLTDCLNIAITNRNVSHHNVFAYMGGIARKRIEELHDAARKIVDSDGEHA